jgi:hypothetical protein
VRAQANKWDFSLFLFLLLRSRDERTPGRAAGVGPGVGPGFGCRGGSGVGPGVGPASCSRQGFGRKTLKAVLFFCRAFLP